MLSNSKDQDFISQTDGPLVSIITPFFNAEKFLSEAIESVLAQSYQKWELFLVDDGSCDASTEIAKRYCTLYSDRIFFLEHSHHRNRGTAASRNLGLSKARGKYVAFLDSDDVWFQHKLLRQMSLLISQPNAVMVFGASQYWYGWNGDPIETSKDHIPDLGIQPDKIYEPPDLVHLLHPLGRGRAPAPSDLLMLRETAEEIGGFNESLHGIYQLYEDQAFLVKVYLKYSVFVSAECWNKYRIHPNSCMSIVSRAGKEKEARTHFLQWFDAYLSSYGNQHSSIREKVRNELAANGMVPEPYESHHIQWGTLRRLVPFSRDWGWDRGLPVDRYYIEKFLSSFSNDIQGSLLEIKDEMYSSKYQNEKVTSRDVLDIDENNPLATIVADLTSSENVPSNHFDCIIFTQTLHVIYDVKAVIRTLHRVLKPNGVLLATFPGITQTSERELPGSWFWSFTRTSTEKLFSNYFEPAKLSVRSYGNVLAAVSFLYGLASEELQKEELDYYDPDYQLLVTVRAVKSQAKDTDAS